MGRSGIMGGRLKNLEGGGGNPFQSSFVATKDT